MDKGQNIDRTWRDWQNMTNCVRHNFCHSIGNFHTHILFPLWQINTSEITVKYLKIHVWIQEVTTDFLLWDSLIYKVLKVYKSFFFFFNACPLRIGQILRENRYMRCWVSMLNLDIISISTIHLFLKKCWRLE